jgi:hypothetical protein
MADAPLHDILRALVDEVVAQVLRQYRLQAEEARRLVGEVLGRDRELCQAAEQAASADRLRRMGVFKKAAAAAKKHVYYSLRRYRPAGTGQQELEQLRVAPAEQRPALARRIAEGHRSTSERLPHLDEFHDRLFERIGRPRTVVDVGCGVQPLLFPFDGPGHCVERYVAVDRDAESIAAVAACATSRGDDRLVALLDDLAGGWGPVLQRAGQTFFDVALMLKVVPVIHRQQPELLDVLARTPAAKWLVTGSRVALARQHDIERRERALLHRFIEQAGRREVQEFVVGEEVGWLVE